MMYDFVRGALVWIAFGVLVLGTIYRLVSLFGLLKRDKVVLPYMKANFALRSILHWVIPFRSHNTRKQYWFTAMSFVFHVFLLAVPLFLCAHVLLWRESLGISWFTLPGGLATAMSFVVVGCGLGFALRRIADPTVRYVSGWGDWLNLLIVVAPFVTGLMSHYQVLPYKVMLTIHIVTGCIWLAAIPFHRLIHAIFFPLTRAYMGSEFGFRNARDW